MMCRHLWCASRRDSLFLQRLHSLQGCCNKGGQRVGERAFRRHRGVEIAHSLAPGALWGIARGNFWSSGASPNRSLNCGRGRNALSCRSLAPKLSPLPDRTAHDCKLTWLVLGGDPAARSHRVEQFTAL